MIKLYKNEELNDLWVIQFDERNYNLNCLIDKMKEILMEYYDELYTFFLEVMRAQYDYKFLIARRCLVLYQIYERIFEYEKEEIEIIGEILSDRIAGKIMGKLKNKKVLIIDDILIHGRRIESLYNNFQKFRANNIDIKVYMVTDDKKCISKSLADKIYYTELAQEWRWKTLSDYIVQAIYASSVPYTSFVSSYTVNREKNEIKFPYMKRVENGSIIQKKSGCTSNILFSRKKRPELFQIFSYSECIREYVNRICENTLYIPYTFTKAIRGDRINAFFENFGKRIECLPEISKELRCSELEDSMWNAYRLNLWNALMCKLAGLYISEEKLEGYEDYDTLVKAFGEQIAWELMNLSKEQCEMILNQSYKGWEKYVCNNLYENEILKSIYGDSIRRGKEYKDGYREYLAANRKIDETRATQNQSRLCGLSIDSIILWGKKIKKITIEEIVKTVLNSMDTGCASVSYGLLENTKNYASMLLTGEQSFRIFLEHYAEIIRNIYFLEQENINAEKYILRMYQEHIIDQRAKQELLEFYFKYKGKVGNCNVVSIIENRSFWKISGVKTSFEKYLKELKEM